MSLRKLFPILLVLCLPAVAQNVNGVPSQSLSGTGLIPQAHAVSPDAEWAFPSGSTNTASEPDITGNGNTATASSALTRISTGGILLPPTTGVYLTTPIQTWTSSVFRICYPIYGNGITLPGYTYGGLWGTSSGTAGVNITLSNQTGAPAGMAPSFFNGSFATTTNTIGGGCHTYAFVLGSPSHIYMDANEVNYGVQGNVAPSATTGFYSIGAGNALNGGFYYYGYVLYGEVFKTTALTFSQVTAETAYVTARSGQPPYLIPTSTSRVPSATFVGDSLTTGNGSTPYTSGLVLNNTYTIQNWGEGGDTICNIAYGFNSRILPVLSTQASGNVISFFAGTNDTLSGNRTPLDTWGCERAAVSAALTADPTAIVLVSTALDRASDQTNKNLLNGYIRAGVPTLGPRVFLVDNAENPLLGANGAATNLTYFGSDQTHPTTAGQLLLAAGFSAAINSANGSGPGNPDSLTGTTALTYANNFVIANFTSNGTLTLRSCAYLTASTITIINPQSTYTVTIAPNGSELINGSNSSITVPANSRIVLRDILTGPTTGGCSWVLQ